MGNKALFWAPRILVILFALFLALFSLDIFDSASSFSDIAIGLFMHNLPSLVLTAILIISWRHDLFGATIFLIFGGACTVGTIISLFVGVRFNPILMIGSVMFLLIGTLFLLGSRKV